MKNKDLAAAIGVSTSTISTIENDGHLCKSLVIGKSLAMLFDVSIDSLLSEDLSNTLSVGERFSIWADKALGPRYAHSTVASFVMRRKRQIEAGYFNPELEFEE